ncbi:MAG: disulfide bond formation protein DsbA [Asticcacaulis sp. 32-58-5]|nr:MAG: disulfide bond formation protein DsbA [Asticcacaulis sp. 32-58-5]
MSLNFGKYLAVAALGLGLMVSACSKSGGDSVKSDDMVMGSDTAPITLIEYASVTCSHCAQFNETVFPDIKKNYIDTGKVKYIFREFLTPPNDVSAAGVLLARCAGDDKYFQVIDSVMRSQREIFETGDAKGVLLRIAKTAGISDEKFNTCVTDEAGLKRINANMESAIKEHNISGTPTFLINGKKYDYKGGDIKEFDAAFAAAAAENK